MTDSTPEQAAGIAEKLTRLQAQIILDSGCYLGRPYRASVVRPLIRRGIFERMERKGFQTRWRLTPLGVAVRAHVSKEGEGE